MISAYDAVGDARRDRTFGDASNRNWTIKQIVFLSELQKIVEGTGHYAKIDLSVRQLCFEDLSKILADDSSGVNLVVVRDEDAPELKHYLRDHDRFSVNSDKFSLWTYHSGKVAWSENKETVSRNCFVINELENRAAYKEPGQVLSLLSQLQERIEEKTQ